MANYPQKKMGGKIKGKQSSFSAKPLFLSVGYNLPYGLRNGDLVTINEVDGGLACECQCPCCNEKLIAKKGKVKLHHFAHYNSPECKGGLESALHKLCKNIIQQHKTFTLPPYISPYGRKMTDALTINVENVYLERRLDNIIPDIIIECKEKKLLVEIEVTHPVDTIKLRKIKKEAYAVLCVDARKMVKQLLDKQDYFLADEEFRRALVLGTDYKRWLHNPKYEKIARKQATEKAARKKAQFKEHNYIKTPKGKVKEFKSFKKRNGYDLFYVDECPIEIRAWQSGPNIGKPYASVDDCRSCVFCNKLELRPHPHTEFIKYLFPNRVDCIGYFDSVPDKANYHISGGGPKPYYQKVGRFLVKHGRDERKFFYRFHKAYNFYLSCGSASVFNLETGELIEQKTLLRQ